MAQFSLFGFKIGKKDEEKELLAFAKPDDLEGTFDIASSYGMSAGGAYGTYIDMEGTAKNEADLISRYRTMVLQPEVDMAIDDIVNEAIVTGRDVPAISIALHNLNVTDKIKAKISDEFAEIMRLLDFNNNGYDIFRKWYVDGRIYYQCVIDPADASAGLQELRFVDPLKIRKVRERKKPEQNVPREATLKKDMSGEYYEYYLYQDKPMSNQPNKMGVGDYSKKQLKIAPDMIAYAGSGVTNAGRKMVISHLHKAIKSLNQLRMIEDSLVIYRISRAPERRIFYIDVGNLPKMKAEQYLRDIMQRYKNKLIYDADTGEVRDDRKIMTMLEDYWLPRREGGRGTEITTLPGGQNLGEIDDIQYFQRKLYKSLNVPVSRLETDASFTLGRATEITRDELKFTRFVERLRKKFTILFDALLEKQLRMKNIVAKEDWAKMKERIHYSFESDSHFSELKEAEMLTNRATLLRDLDDYAGKYFSAEFVRRHILRQSEEEMAELAQQMAQEKNDPKYNNNDDDQGGGFGGGRGY